MFEEFDKNFKLFNYYAEVRFFVEYLKNYIFFLWTIKKCNKSRSGPDSGSMAFFYSKKLQKNILL